MALSQLSREILPLFLDYEPEIIIKDIDPVFGHIQLIKIKYYQIKIKHKFVFELCDPNQFDIQIGSKLDKFILAVKSGNPCNRILTASNTNILKKIKFGRVFFPKILEFIGKLKILLRVHKQVRLIDQEYETKIYPKKIKTKYYPYNYPNYKLIPLDKLLYYFKNINSQIPDSGIDYPLLQNNSKILCVL